MLAFAGQGGGVLVERDAELVLLGHAVDEAARGGGSLTLIDGAPGTGKSALLQTVRERASDLGHTLLTARGSPEEIEFPYGLVRQLIGPVLRTDMGRRATDNGVAQHALRLVDPASAPQAPVDTTYSMLQGLYWLLSNLSTITPVVVTIDDLHVGDTPSLEFLRFLGNRLDGERIAVVCAGDTSAPAGSLATALLDVAQHTTRLRPLTQEAVGTLVEDTLGRTLAGALAEACHVATGGNPFFLNELLASLRAESKALLTPSDVRRLAPQSVTQAVQRSLEASSANATALAQAIAVAGDGTPLEALGRLFDADADETATALDELVAAGLVHADLPPRFIQPIVARAVYSSIPPGRRAQLHAQAALSSVGLRDSPDRVAPHLLAIPPAGDAKAVQILMAAAGQAMAAGAPGTAVRYLERALAEPPAEELRGGVLMMLGSVGSMIGASTALDHLSEAMEAASDPGQLAQAAYAFGLGMLFTGRMPFALGSLNRALDRLAAASPEVRRDVAELLLIAGETALQIRDSLRPDLDEAVQRVASDGLDASPTLLAVAALELAMCHGDTARARELATRATDVGSGLSAETPQLYLATGTLSIIGEHGASETRLNLALEEAQASGSARGVALVSCWRARNRLLRGALSECEEDVAAFNDLDRELDLVTFRALVKATHIDLLIEQGRLADAEAVAASIDWDREDDLTSFYAVVRESMGRLALERGHAEQALEFLEPLEGYEERWGDRGAVWTQWRPVAVRTHLQLGHARRAHGLAREHLEQALDVRVPRSIILGHRAVAATVDDEMAGKHLREAVSIADASGLLLEEAHAHAELGRLHQRIGSTDDAQQELRQAMDLAHRCGAFALRERAHRQLLDMGARPRRPHLSGPESLTASERRVVRLAMRGLSNRQIGQELMVTVKTVETHLTNSYRKLSISSRADLADAMGEGD